MHGMCRDQSRRWSNVPRRCRLLRSCVLAVIPEDVSLVVISNYFSQVPARFGVTIRVFSKPESADRSSKTFALIRWLHPILNREGFQLLGVGNAVRCCE